MCVSGFIVYDETESVKKKKEINKDKLSELVDPINSYRDDRYL